MKLEFHISMTAAEAIELVRATRGREAPTQKPRQVNSGQSKSAMIRAMLLRPNGVTTPEAKAATGWPTIGINSRARKWGIDIYKREMDAGYTRYFGRRNGDPAP